VYHSIARNITKIHSEITGDIATNIESLTCVTRIENSTIFVVEDEYLTRQGICELLKDEGWGAEGFDSCELFLEAYRQRPGSCVVLDLHFPGMSGLELLGRIGAMTDSPPVIVVSGSSEISEAVRSIQGGAADFIEKPVARDRLIASVRSALGRSGYSRRASTSRNEALDHIANLTSRQRQIMALVLAGQPSKNIAADLGISQRTVENHRASIMRKTGANSLPALARLVSCSDCALIP